MVHKMMLQFENIGVRLVEATCALSVDGVVVIMSFTMGIH